jgi:hypothetical protein
VVADNLVEGWVRLIVETCELRRVAAASALPLLFDLDLTNSRRNGRR